MITVNGDILEVKTGYILQQCNCVTVSPHGLSADLEAKFPGTCPYLLRTRGPYGNFAREEDHDIPGSVSIVQNEGGPAIVNIFGQVSPGKPGCWYANLIKDRDSAGARLGYFREGLLALIDYFEGDEGEIEIAVPYRIGCGLAGGDWKKYYALLEEFEKNCRENNLQVKITIYNKI